MSKAWGRLCKFMCASQKVWTLLKYLQIEIEIEIEIFNWKSKFVNLTFLKQYHELQEAQKCPSFLVKLHLAFYNNQISECRSLGLAKSNNSTNHHFDKDFLGELCFFQHYFQPIHLKLSSKSQSEIEQMLFLDCNLQLTEFIMLLGDIRFESLLTSLRLWNFVDVK